MQYHFYCTLKYDIAQGGCAAEYNIIFQSAIKR